MLHIGKRQVRIKLYIRIGVSSIPMSTCLGVFKHWVGGPSNIAPGAEVDGSKSLLISRLFKEEK